MLSIDIQKISKMKMIDNIQFQKMYLICIVE